MFKVGDKVKLPSKNTFAGGNHNINTCISYLEAKKINQDYLYITSISGVEISTGITSTRITTFFDISDLELYEEFVLPDKWVVQNNSEIKYSLHEWFKNNIGRIPRDRDNNSYWHYPETEAGGVCTQSSMEDGYTLITSEQFRKYVLNTSIDGYTTDEQWINILLNQT